MTDDLGRVARWVEVNKLRLNVGKTQLLLLSRKHRKHELEQVRVKIDDQDVARSTKTKCLGVVIDDGLKWQEHIADVRRKCFAGLAKMIKKGVLSVSTR